MNDSSPLSMGSLGIQDRIKQMVPHNRASYRSIVLLLQEREMCDVAADITIREMVSAINDGSMLSSTCRRIGRSITLALELEDTPNTALIKLGGAMLDIAAQLELIRIVKNTAISKAGKIKEMWMLSCLSNELRNMANNRVNIKMTANNGYQEWERPTMYLDNFKTDIVMRARRCNLLHNYRKDKMPSVYNALNKLGRTEWVINTDVLDIIKANPKCVLLPEVVGEKELKTASDIINHTNRTALYIHEIIFNELIGKGYAKTDAKKETEHKVATYTAKHAKDAKKILRKWSQRRDFETVMGLSTGYGEDILNFLYRCDSRGRVYCFNSNYLNPQGSDASKALLSFSNPKPVSVSDLAITIANHAGRDKLSYDERLKWVSDNEDYILEVGTNPSTPTISKWLNDNDISTEEKSRMQFLAACVEWVKLTDWVSNGRKQEDFLCSIPVAYDATNSGLQILSIIGRDDYIAPYVNICATETVGDVYRLIGKAVAEKSPVASLEAVLPPEDSMWRKIVKRNVMTKSYAATEFGMGTQQWEDKPDSNPEKNSEAKEVWANMKFKECIALGKATYRTCDEFLPQAASLMKACQTAVSFNGNATVSWTLPNGFTAFQHKESMEEDQTIKLRVGEETAFVKTYKMTGKSDSRKHNAAIAPDVVHSIDAWLLSLIVNSLPEDANLAFVHDAFGSDSYYGDTVQNCARQAYYDISDREVFSLILRQIADGNDVELPEPGSYDPNEIFNADYIVC